MLAGKYKAVFLKGYRPNKKLPTAWAAGNFLNIFFYVFRHFTACDDLVNQSVLKRTLCRHEVIAVCIFRNDFQRLARAF
jgi:hypothetical protein